MIELPTPITIDEFIQPANLTQSCQIPHLGKQEIIGAGTGMIGLITKNHGYKLHEATLETISSELCSTGTKNKLDPNTILCADVMEKQQALSEGDSGI